MQASERRIPITDSHIHSAVNNENSNVNIKHDNGRVKFTIFEGLYYYTPITFLFMCILALPLELGDFIENFAENEILILTNWYKFLLAGLLGFGCNVAAFLVTGSISALYLKALGTFRSVCLIVIAVILFEEIVTTQEMFGYGVTLVGFIYYNYIKFQQK